MYNELHTGEFIGSLEMRRELVIEYSCIPDVLQQHSFFEPNNNRSIGDNNGVTHRRSAGIA